MRRRPARPGGRAGLPSCRPPTQASARRGRPVQGGLGRQPGGDRGAGHAERHPVVGGVTNGVNRPSGNASASRVSNCPAKVTGEGVSLPAHSRNSTGRHVGPLVNGAARRSRRSPTGCRAPAWPGPARPRRGSRTRHAPSCPTGATGCHRPRPSAARPPPPAGPRPAGPRPDQAGRHPNGAWRRTGARWNETTTAMPPGKHPDHGTPRSAGRQTSGQQHEQPERGRAGKHRPQRVQHLKPRGR